MVTAPQPVDELNDTAIRQVVKPRQLPGDKARQQAALSAHALEEDRGRQYADYEREQIARDGYGMDRPYREPIE